MIMAKSEFIGNIDAEQQRISARFLEIDDTINRLEEERRLMRERAESLETIRDLYLRTEMSLQEIKDAHSDLSRFASNGAEPTISNSIRDEQLLMHSDLSNH